VQLLVQERLPAGEVDDAHADALQVIEVALGVLERDQGRRLLPDVAEPAFRVAAIGDVVVAEDGLHEAKGMRGRKLRRDGHAVSSQEAWRIEGVDEWSNRRKARTNSRRRASPSSPHPFIPASTPSPLTHKKAPASHRRPGLGKNLAATYSPTLSGSTIGAAGLNCSVRYGKRCFPRAIATKKLVTCRGVIEVRLELRHRAASAALVRKHATG
jgi:hypothetical protein